jgi:hypothetical protein
MKSEKPRTQTERKRYGAKLSHVTRHLNEKKPMTGKVLETALRLVTCDDPTAGINSDPFFQKIAKKMIAGEPLDDYEYHMVVDVHMVHSKF